MRGIAKFLAKGDFATRTLGKSSALNNFIHPAGRVLANAAEGKAINARSLVDPGGAVLKDPNAIKAPPGAPTIDEARQAIDESDRLRKRRGVYANIFAGAAGMPTVSKSTLGG